MEDLKAIHWSDDALDSQEQKSSQIIATEVVPETQPSPAKKSNGNETQNPPQQKKAVSEKVCFKILSLCSEMHFYSLIIHKKVNVLPSTIQNEMAPNNLYVSMLAS